MVSMTVGDRIAWARHLRGMTVSALEKEAKVKNRVSRYETGKRAKRTLDTLFLEKLAKVLRVDPHWLILGTGDTVDSEGTKAPKPLETDDIDAAVRNFPERWPDHVVLALRQAKHRRGKPSEGTVYELLDALLPTLAPDHRKLGGRPRKAVA